MSDLATAMHCDNSNVTGIVDRLEERGLVERRPADHDRRVKLIAVTASGSRLRDELNRRLAEPPEAITNLFRRRSARPARHPAPRRRRVGPDRTGHEAFPPVLSNFGGEG